MRWSMQWLLLSCLLLAACGGDDGGGGPPGAGTGGGGGSAGSGGGPVNDGSAFDIYVSEPGVCRALCCADSDCQSGQTCEPFVAAAGTLGVCKGSPGDAGSTASDGGTPSFPASCWTVTTAECNPLTNESCGPGGACDVGGLGDSATKPVVACFYDDNIQGPGEACDNGEGPFCVPGYHCSP